MSSILTLPNGKYHDRIINRQDQIIDFGWRSNIIVDRCRYLLASFMKNERPRGRLPNAVGISKIYIGKGMETWDTDFPPKPLPTIEQLADPDPFISVIKPSQIVFLDTDGNKTEDPTHRLQISVTLKPEQPPIEGEATTYPLREFALVGRLKNKDILINYVRHPVIHKRADETLNRTIRLIF